MKEEIKLSTTDLSVGYPGAALSSGLNLKACRGEFICLMGPNGVGKSTLLRALGTLQPPLDGDVWVDGRAVYQLGVKERAKLISLVLTERVDVGFLTVIELVSMGRHPHTGWDGRMADQDKKAVQQALATTGLGDLMQRQVRELSDGQLQKVYIARALAQDCDLMLLDEPLIHLDISSKWEIMNLLRKTAVQHQKVLIMATHELELSIKLADKIWLMHSNGSINCASPEDHVLEGSFNSIFDNEAYHFSSESGSFLMNAPAQDIIVLGPEPANTWTKRALTRKGWNQEKFPQVRSITIELSSEKLIWQIKTINKTVACRSIESLLNQFDHA